MNRVTPNQSQPSRMASAPESMGMPINHAKGETKHSGRGDKNDLFTKWSKLGTNILLFVMALLVATLAWLIYTTTPTSEYSYVNNSKLQAVFLNNGQVYFGNIQSLNNNYVILTNVFYLQTNSNSTSSTSSTANQNVSLVKLGCELHQPYDEMIINNSQVTFWENLKSTGQVAQAVAQFDKTHPNGQQTCSTTGQTQSPTTSSLQNSTGTAPTTTPVK